jgi:hypothetical protein
LRPTNVWNLIFPNFNKFLGDFYLSQNRIRVLPYIGATSDAARLFEELCEDTRMRSDDVDESAFTTMDGFNRRGWWSVFWTNELHPEGSPVIRNVDQFEITFDPKALHRAEVNGKYLFRSRWMNKEQIISKVPHLRTELSTIMQSWKDGENITSWNDPFAEKMIRDRDFVNEDGSEYRVIEAHEFVWDRRDVVESPEGDREIVNLEGKKRDLFMRVRQRQGYEVLEEDAKVKQVSVIIPGLSYMISQDEAELQDEVFDYISFSPYRFGNLAINHFGLMENSIGPQDEFNDSRNRLQEILDKSANAPILTKPSKILNYPILKKRGARPGVFIEFEDDAQFEDAFKQADIPKIPFAFANLSDTAYTLLSRIMGITENLRGETQTSHENASLFAQRVREAVKSYVPIQRSYYNSERMKYNKVIKYFQKYCGMDRFWELITADPMRGGMLALNVQLGEQIINDIGSGTYKVCPITDDQNQSMKQMTFTEKTTLISMIYQLFGQMAQVGVPIRWWLQDAPFANMETVIQGLETLQKTVAAGMGANSAMNTAAGILDLAGKRVALSEDNSSPTTGAPAPTGTTG